MSAVSNRVMPSSRAASTTARVAASSMRPPKLLQPTPTTDTCRLPILRVFITRRLYGLCPEGVPGGLVVEVVLGAGDPAVLDLTHQREADVERAAVTCPSHPVQVRGACVAGHGVDEVHRERAARLLHQLPEVGERRVLALVSLGQRVAAA